MNTTSPQPSRKLLTIFGTIALVLLLVIVFFGYNNQKEKIDVVMLSSNALTVNTGDAFLVSLESNPSTGYSWALKNTYDNSIVSFNGSSYADNANAPIGTPGTEDWSFTGLKPGQTTLKFEYARIWESDTDPAQTQVYRITVK